MKCTRRQGSNILRENVVGMTLIELVVVVALIAIIGSVIVVRVDSILGWKLESELRKFSHTLQLLRSDSVQRQERYRLVIDLDTQSYYVRREVPLDPGESLDVDYLANLRTKGEQIRRQEAEESELQSLDEEFREQDLRLGGSLESLYYQSAFADPFASVRLGVPLSFPSLAERQELDSGIRIRDVEIGEDRITEGRVSLRFIGRNAAPEALIHFTAEENVYTIVLHPQLAHVQILAKDVNAEEAFDSLQVEDDDDSR